MFADFGRFRLEFDHNKERCLQWIKAKQLGMCNSITLLGKDSELLVIRTPITNEKVEIYGEANEIAWLHLQMVRNKMYILK